MSGQLRRISWLQYASTGLSIKIGQIDGLTIKEVLTINRPMESVVNHTRRYELLGGYLKVHGAFNRFFNIVLSLTLIIINIPFFIILPIIIKLQDGKEVLYRGVRLGQHKKPYYMYKFRTLSSGAEKKIGQELLSPKHNLVTPFGKFLRDTRLDELPQLFNILRGDMDFVGPRPERPIIYEKICQYIKGYDLRFEVRPGLVGYSQLFTPHSSPKAIRTLIDNRFMKKSQSFPGEISILFFTVIVLSRTLIARFSRLISTMYKKMSGDQERRQLDRIAPSDARVLIVSGETGKALDSKVVDINEDFFLIYSDREITDEELQIKLRIVFDSGVLKKKIKTKTAKCTGRIHLRKKSPGSAREHAYVIQYKPLSPLNFYFVHQYFLQESVAY